MRALLTGLMLAALAGTTPVLAATSPHLRIAQSELGRTQYVEIGVNKSIIIDLPVEAGEVIVSQPGVANALMRTRTRAVIQGIAAGETNILFLDSSGGGIAVIEISVAQDSSGLAATINRLLPGSRVQVQSFADSVILSGDVQSGDDMEKAVAIAAQYVGGESNVTSVINVAGGQQVALKVVVAEIKRDAAQALGINLSGSLSVGALNLGLNSAPATGDSAGSYSGDFSQGGFSIDASLQALQSQNALRLLAEPVLTAMSGQEANFHVGGELPIRVVSDGEESYDYKEYGIKLNFSPTVRSNGLIALDINTEVSEISDTISGALNTRSASTSVELPAHQTLAIAGLLEERTRRQINELPGLGNIPILGALFRSYEYSTSQTELVILVTPVIAQPSVTPVATPDDFYQPSSDAEAIFLGRMESMYGVGGAAGGQFRGSVGFMLD
ncbi:type II and III secretion system protein family protein [Pelagibacterium flavum]|uniref:Type II and III secretion system protein family protein n=1 Tax=Pelagibacterium flavum TaxID=2984530 RepID=A0ABY6IMK8_9HYPH|nr:type II and III secretion system protein family protein [Pelagibacterium sp. YIM 151497]UYQ71837.1 type II and III secretion system protein family protein [Pelagibacterium sp. YIM 151497]